MSSRLRTSAASVLLLLLLLSSSESIVESSSLVDRRYDYESIICFGDSYADTGNNPVVSEWYSILDPVMRPPFGSTFFGRPTGRDSDGRLIIDFVAERLGLPFLTPSLAHNGSFRHGANFAVGGSTALDAGFFHDGDSTSLFPLNTSLGVQLQWFESLKPKLCATAQECEDFFGRSLFFVGEFGVNDYHFSFGRKSIKEIRSFVPDIIRTISIAIERLIKHGAVNLVVPGVLPSGCTPTVLDMSADQAVPTDYNSTTGCLQEINDLGAHHNSLLQDALHKLQAKHPEVSIIYADFFSPVMEMVESPAKFGFEEVLTACCRGPESALCGEPGTTICEDPSARLFWEGVHLTEAAYRYIADGWLSSITSTANARESS